MVDAGRLVDLSSALRIDCRLSRKAALSFLAAAICSELVEAIPWGSGAPPARPGIRIGRGARCRWFDLRRPGRWIDRRSARRRADHRRSWRNRPTDVPRGRAERGPGTGEGREAAPAACYRWRAAASASPLAAPVGLRLGPAGAVKRLFCLAQRSSDS